MKLYNKIGAIACSMALMTSCAVHDPFADKMDIGQTLPTVSWELGSTVCKAGEPVSFKAKYYTSADRVVDHTEVWTAVTRNESAAATVKLTSSLAYTKTVAGTDTVRSSQMSSTYPHSQAEWDGYEYVLTSSFPTSKTLSPVSWVNPGEWDQEKFDSYYSSTFQDEFKATVMNYLTKDSAYYNDLRSVYVKYDFTADQFTALAQKYNLEFPTETESGNKSDLWFSDQSIVDHYYYITVNADGVRAEHEIATKAEAPEGVNVYDVYKSSKWVYCRYSDDSGSAVSSVRAEYMPMFKEMLELIPFTGWIYNSSEKTYAVEFSRKYSLIPAVKVYDKEGKVGTDTDSKIVELN